MMPFTGIAILTAVLELLQGAELQAEPLKVDEKAGTVSFGAVTLKLDSQPQLLGVIEYVVVNKGGKNYESLFTADIDAGALYEGLKKIGVQPGKPPGEGVPPTGGKLKVSIEWKDGDKARKEPIEAFVLDTKTGKPMEPVEWIFTGSRKGFVPELEKSDLIVKTTKNLMALAQVDSSVLVMNPVADATGHRWKGNKEVHLKEGTPVRIVFEAAK